MKAYPLLALALSLVGAGCMTGPQPVKYSPRDYLTANQASRLWLTLTDGRQLVVYGPRVITDTVFAWDETGTEDLIIPVGNIKEVRARRLSVVRTAILPIAAVVGGIAAVALISNDGSTAPPDFSQCEELEIDCDF
jgi:hypothetical protein